MAEILIWLLIGALMLLPPIGIFLWFWFDRFNAKIIYYDTAETCRVFGNPIENGILKFNLGKKTLVYDLNKTKPKQIKTWFGYKPLYMVSWCNPLGMETDFTKGAINHSKYSPEVIGEVLKSDTINKLLNPKKDTMAVIMFIILGVMIGVVLGILGAKMFLGGA